eukprot:TRINITY_DN2412_c0_g2_i1.p1 TRINITY_DN2412_c0_g2~~TRINITY_DN2412_c0_g2_i1.p1  ORF type:complete len:882 (-),score=178.89 TRINITY_DN2412_c0_g2_i1:204-2849(-)
MSSRPNPLTRPSSKTHASFDDASTLDSSSLRKAALSPISRSQTPFDSKSSQSSKTEALHGVPFIMAFTAPSPTPLTDTHRAPSTLSPLSKGILERKDISFNADKPGHGRIPSRSDGMEEYIPPSLIPPEHHVIDKAKFPPSDTDYKYEYDEKERVWKATVFPGLRPSSRREVVLLDKWLNDQLTQSMSRNKDPIEIVREAQFLYSASFNEIVRQVSVHCQERGKLLSKIWNRYIQLFEIVMELRDQEKEQFAAKLAASESAIQNLRMDLENQVLTLQLQFQSERRALLHQQQRLEQHINKLSQENTTRLDHERNMKLKLKAVMSLVMQTKKSKNEVATDDIEQELASLNVDDDDTNAQISPHRRQSDIMSEIPILPTRASKTKDSEPPSSTSQPPSLLTILSHATAGASPRNRGAKSESSHSEAANPTNSPTTPSAPDSIVATIHGSNTGPESRANIQILRGGVLIPERWLKFLRSIPKDASQASVLSEDWINGFIMFMYRAVAEDILMTYPRLSKGLAQKSQPGRPKPFSTENRDIQPEAGTYNPKMARLSLPDMIYSYFLQLYGLRSTAEKHLLDLANTLLTLSNPKTRPRMHLFARFAGLYDELPRDALDFYIYESCMLSMTFSRIYRPGTVDSVQPFCFCKDEGIKLPYNIVLEALQATFAFLPPDSLSELQNSVELNSLIDDGTGKKEILAHLYLTLGANKWYEMSSQSLGQFEKSVRSSLTGLISFDNFIVGIQRLDGSRSRTEVLQMFREAIMNSSDNGEDISHDAIEDILRKNGLLRDNSAAVIGEIVKDESRTQLKAAEFAFLTENWNAYFNSIEDLSDDLLRRKLISAQVHAEMHDQMKFMSKLIASEADPALVLSSFRLLLVRIYQFTST